MDKSIIANKSTIEQAVRAEVRRVRTWTRKELQALLDKTNADRQKPIIVPLGNAGFLIGNYAIRRNHDSWSMIYRYNDRELEFTDQESALLYAVLQQIGRGEVADQLLVHDQNITRLTQETQRFRLRYQQASQRRNTHQQDLYSCRYNHTQMQLQHHRQLLAKTLKMAKYYNL